MIGAAVYRLVAGMDGKIQETQGRLLHAAFFQIIKSYSVELAAMTHDDVRFKAFTVSELFPVNKVTHAGNYLSVKKGDSFNWRVTALNDEILKAMMAVPEGYVLQAGPVSFKVEQVLTEESDGLGVVGLLDENRLIAACLAVDKVQRISFEFISPVSFRSFQDDYPFPLPQLIFGSVADKWNLAGMPVALDKDEVREFSSVLLPVSWKGQTKQVFLKKDRGVTGFIGNFTFNVSMLPKDMQQLFLLLAQFSQFSGVGRLTGQGLGQTSITFR